jgi:predicted ABC-type ATPase
MDDRIIPNHILTNYIEKQFHGKSQQRNAFIIIGGPSSGKNTHKSIPIHELGLDEHTFALLDEDIILDTFYENNETYRGYAKKINKHILDYAIRGNYDMIYCGTGKNYNNYLSNIIRRLKQQHYKVYLSIIYNTLDIAIPRARLRSAITGRHFEEDFIKMAYSMVDKAIMQYMKLDCSEIDGIFMIDNTNDTNQPKLLYVATCANNIKSVKCYDVTYNHRFLSEFCPTLWADIVHMCMNAMIIAIVSALITYYVMIIYKLPWTAFIITMTIIFYCTAKAKVWQKTIQEIAITSLMSSMAIFIVLQYRYSSSESIGMAGLSGIIAATILQSA